MDLVFIKFSSDLQDPRIRDFLEQRPSQAIPMMPKAALAMAESGYTDLSLPIDFLDVPQKEAVYEQAIELSKTWYAPFHSDLFFHDMDLADCCRLQMLAFFQDVIAAEKIWPILLQSFKPERAVFKSVPSVPSFDQNMHNGMADVFEAVLQWRLSQNGVQIRILNQSAQPVAAAVKPISLSNAPCPGRLALRDLPADKALITALGDDYDLLFLWPYLKSIAAQIDAYPFLLNALPTLSVHTVRSGLNKAEPLPFLYVNDLPIEYSSPAALLRVRKKGLQALTQDGIFPAILQNPLLKFQFEYFFDVLIPGCIKAVLRAEYLFSKFHIKLYMDDYCISHICRAWTQVAQKWGVRSATVSHSAMAPLTEFNDFNADCALMWGQLSKMNFEKTSYEKKDQIRMAGNPSIQTLAKPSAPDRSAKKSILLITGGFLQQVWTDFSLNRFLHTWQSILNHIDQFPHIHFIVKPHPSYRDFGYWYKRQIDTRRLSNISYMDDKRLEDLLDDIYLSVLIGKPGTAPLVSMRHAVPVVYLDCLLNRKVKGYEAWVQNGYVPYFDSVEDLFALIAKISSDRSAYDRLTQANLAFTAFILSPFQPRDLVNQLGLNATF